MKEIAFIKRSSGRHWVGNGFPVQSIFSYNDIAEEMSPFLLMDYAGPADFAPTSERRGVGQHPHRGFEAVTLVYAGGVSHRDSSGGGGTIGPGDVQWMTAASGLIHEEYHSEDFARQGGPFEMVQLWVNLPAGHTTALFVLHGSIQMGAHTVRAAELAVMEREGTQLAFDVVEDAVLLLLNGEPLNEPIVGHGPFVMNSQEEIIQAIHDYNSGKFGQIVH